MHTTDWPLDQWLDALKPLAQLAGENILEIYADVERHDVQHKADASPVTAADLSAHVCLLEGLQRLTPDIPVLSEESEYKEFSERQSWSHFWLIDPLDGTREFIHRTGEFAINIAFIAHHQPVLGMIYAPLFQEFYWAHTGGGAFKARLGEAPSPISVNRVDEEAPLRVVMSRRHHDKVRDVLHSWLPHHKVVHIGSALKICWVAEGKADIYPRLGPTSEWDTAAGQCILEEAGGQLMDAAGQPLRYNTKASLENPSFFAVGDKIINWTDHLARLDKLVHFR